MANKRVRVENAISGSTRSPGVTTIPSEALGSSPTMERTASSPTIPVIVREGEAAPKSTPLSDNERKIRKFAVQGARGGFSKQADASMMDSFNNGIYSPQLSTDFLEQPQNIREQIAFYRFFYRKHEIIGRAIDIHSTLPLSKVRLIPPKGKNKHMNEYVFKYFENMCNRMKLFKNLIAIAHEYWLVGFGYVFAEENDWKDNLPPEEVAVRKEKSQTRAQYLNKTFGIIDKDPDYLGWDRLVVLPPEQVKVKKILMTDDYAISFCPDSETKSMLMKEQADDSLRGVYEQGVKPPSNRFADKVLDSVASSGEIPLDTDPNKGSHVFLLSRKKSQYEPRGTSIIERCIPTLILMDKLRQAQAAIASRHMTPMRLIWIENGSDVDVDALREMVDYALVDPDFSIITNYEVHWEEMSSNGRLLDISAENESALQRLYAGLGVTAELLTGSGSYSGSRVSQEVLNNGYMLFREEIQEYVEENLFKPVARKKGFMEYDDYGNEVLLYPKLSFTRLAIRDNDQFFDAAFQLYQKGSISIDLILDILNIDPDSTREKIEKDLFTVNDSNFNEFTRNVYSAAASAVVTNTNIIQKLADYVGLTVVPEEPPKEDGGSRFASQTPNNVSDDQSEKMKKVMGYLLKNPEILNKIFDNSSKSKA